MTFQNSFTLRKYMTEAREQYTATIARLDALDDILEKQIGGNTQSNLIAGLAGSALWGAAYILAFSYFRGQNSTIFLTIALITSLLLMVCMIFGRIRRTKYYGSIQQTRNQVAQMKHRIELAESSLSANLHTYLGCRDAQWNCTLDPGESISDEADIIERAAGTMEALQTGSISKLQNILYYITCGAWAVGGTLGLKYIFTSIVSGEVSSDTANTILIIGAVIALVLDLILAKFLWGVTDCAVTNLTLFATIAGPVIFAVLAAVIGLAILLLVLVFKLIVGLLALFIGGSIVLGILSGGG